MNIIIANSAQYFWESNLIKKFHSIKEVSSNIFFVKNSKELGDTIESIKESIDYIFFMHWSYKVSTQIHSRIKCIIFHMTDLPFGRGGSPLQNLLIRNIYQTKICAISCKDDIDSGDIYFKEDLSLYGTAQEIYIRTSEKVIDMIQKIVTEKTKPFKQKGLVSFFKRLKPHESNIENISSLEKVFDHIRMLDADGYPKAFIETEYLKISFTRASFRGSSIIADAKIRLKQ